MAVQLNPSLNSLSLGAKKSGSLVGSNPGISAAQSPAGEAAFSSLLSAEALSSKGSAEKPEIPQTTSDAAAQLLAAQLLASQSLTAQSLKAQSPAEQWSSAQLPSAQTEAIVSPGAQELTSSHAQMLAVPQDNVKTDLQKAFSADAVLQKFIQSKIPSSALDPSGVQASQFHSKQNVQQADSPFIQNAGSEVPQEIQNLLSRSPDALDVSNHPPDTAAILSHRPVSASTLHHLTGADFLQSLNPSLNAASQNLNRPEKFSPGKDSLKNPEQGIQQAQILNLPTLGLEKVKARSDAQALQWQDPSQAMIQQQGSGFSQAPQAADAFAAAPAITATVTQNGQAQNRLTSDSIRSIGGMMQQLNVSGQDSGTIRIRLNPEHLGEIQLKVKTLGSQVSVQVNASDDHAKKIIESSLNDLKEQLSSKNLNLASFDIQQNSSSSSSMNSLGQHDRSSDLLQQGRDFTQRQNDGFGQDQQQQDRPGLFGSSERISRPLVSNAFAAARMKQAASGPGRLDVMA